jgi:hypothetical protein
MVESAPRREWRAARAFRILAAFSGIVWLIILLGAASGLGAPGGVFTFSLDVATGDWLAFLLAGLVPLGGWIAADAIDRRRGWAMAALEPLLYLIVLVDLISFGIGLSQSRFQIPLGLLLALWVWSAAPSGDWPARFDLRSVALIAMFVVGPITGVVVDRLVGPEGLLRATQDSLVGQLSVDCGPAGPGAPPTVTLTYDWSWRRSEPFATGPDMVVVAWTSTDWRSGSLYVLGSDPNGDVGSAGDPGIASGVSGWPDTELADGFASGWDQSWDWMVERGDRQFEPGQVRLTLQRATVAVPHGRLDVRGAYVHAGVWRADSDLTTCQW